MSDVHRDHGPVLPAMTLYRDKAVAVEDRGPVRFNELVHRSRWYGPDIVLYCNHKIILSKATDSPKRTESCWFDDDPEALVTCILCWGLR